MNKIEIEVEKMDFNSLNVAEVKQAELFRIFPEVRTEGGKINFEKLRIVLGQMIDVGKERYGMNWPGKAECFTTIQTPSIGTLRPIKNESINFEMTQNVFIKGDNLETLKLLQKSYLQKIKMIYIDPPYNTGSDFIYPDNYSESLQTYLQYTKQVDSEGKKFGTNNDTDGRFHSKWMNMIYPRLYLAKNLLRDDGVVFISIDDCEYSNLKKICDDIFGEENFVCSITREAIKGGSLSKHLRVTHDYVLAYSKNIELLDFGGYEQDGAELTLKDEKGPYAKGRELNKWGAGSRREDAPGMFFPIKGPSGENVFPIRNDGSEGRWRLGKERLNQLVADGDVIFEKRENGTYIVYEKIRNSDPRIKQFTTIFKDNYINAKGTERIKSLFSIERTFFDYAKPTELVFDLMVMADLKKGDIVLDFFAGSGTTADAAFQYSNSRNPINFILVQLPEPVDSTSEAFKLGYKFISDATLARIVKASNDISKEIQNESIDIGVKVFNLESSCFKAWDQNIKSENIKKQLEFHVDNIREELSDEDLLTEILLKKGFPLTTEVQSTKFGDQNFFSVSGGMLLICLSKQLNLDFIKYMANQKPAQVVFLDQGFENNDQLKANAVQIFKSMGVLDFKTV